MRASEPICRYMALVLRRQERATMKFRVEVTRTNGADRVVLHRSFLDAISPHQAKAKAADLSKAHARRGANGARLLNDKNEELYRW